MPRKNLSDDHDSGTIEKRWREIPHYSLGEVPEELPDENPLLYRRIVAKRAIVAAYEDEVPQQCVNDLLSDLRHLCDALGLDFAQCDREAYRAYARERVAAAHGRKPR